MNPEMEKSLKTVFDKNDMSVRLFNILQSKDLETFEDLLDNMNTDFFEGKIKFKRENRKLLFNNKLEGFGGKSFSELEDLINEITNGEFKEVCKYYRKTREIF